MSRYSLTLSCLVACILSMRCVIAQATTGTETQHTASSPQESCASCGPGAPPDQSEEPVDLDFLEAVKRHILNRLQMRERPIITHPIPKAAMVTALRRLHAGKVREDGGVEIPDFDNEVQEETSEIISFGESDDQASSEYSLHFLISNEGNQNLHVSQANLWLYFRMPPAAGPDKVTVTVKVHYQEAGGGAVGGGGPARGGGGGVGGGGSGAASRWTLVEKRVALKRSGWRAFPLSAAAVRAAFGEGGRWRQDLEVRCEACEAAAAVVPVLVDPGDPSHRPLLVVRVRPRTNGKRRIRKRGLECDDGSSAGGRLCCRRQFYIDFRRIGWNNWIIAPPGYYGYYCEGSCPAYMAGVQGSAAAFMHRIRGCCIPTKLGTMSMLYVNDQNNIVKRDVPNMIVEECGCA